MDELYYESLIMLQSNLTNAVFYMYFLTVLRKLCHRAISKEFLEYLYDRE